MRRLYVLRGRPHRRERTYKPTRLFRYTADRIGCDSGWTRFLWSGFRSRQGLYQKVVHPVRSENSPLRRRRDEPLLPAEGNRSAFRPSQGRLATALGFGRMFQTTAERPIPGLGCCPSRVIVYTGTAMNKFTKRYCSLFVRLSFAFWTPDGRSHLCPRSVGRNQALPNVNSLIPNVKMGLFGQICAQSPMHNSAQFRTIAHKPTNRGTLRALPRAMLAYRRGPTANLAPHSARRSDAKTTAPACGILFLRAKSCHRGRARRCLPAIPACRAW